VLSRSERYLENAEKCQRRADRTDETIALLLDKIRHTHVLRKIDKAEGAIRKFKVILEGALATETPARNLS